MTLSELRALCRLSLASSSAWPDNTLDNWIRAAIRLYSAHFPHHWRRLITLTTGTQAYAIWGDWTNSATWTYPAGVDVTAILGVEYPYGENPPRYLRCVARDSDLFFPGAQAYAVIGPLNSAGTSDGHWIEFCETVTTGETAQVEYLASHPLPVVGQSSAIITLPEAHVEAVVAFVEFAALHVLEVDEAVVVDDNSIVLSQLGQEARRAWNRYKEVMDRLLYLAPCNMVAAHVPVWGDIGL